MRAMLDLAVNGGEENLVLLKDIAARQGVSKRYLEHMMTLLRNRRLVVAERGARGGYRLGRPPEKIKLDEIFEALEGAIEPIECVRDEYSCPRTAECVARDLWCELADSMKSVLSGKTLADLRREYEEKMGA